MILEKIELNDQDVDSDPETISDVIKKSNLIDFTLEDVQIINVSKPSLSPRETVSECFPELEELQ